MNAEEFRKAVQQTVEHIANHPPFQGPSLNPSLPLAFQWGEILTALSGNTSMRLERLRLSARFVPIAASAGFADGDVSQSSPSRQLVPQFDPALGQGTHRP
jgi:hypothetical protein